MSSRNAVPCNGCSACCRKQQVILSPENGDDPKLYLVEEARTGIGMKVWVLLHKENGDCIYLGDRGCEIYDVAPWACRTFDCRKWLLELPEALPELLQVDDHYGLIVKAAKERL